jgi:hypothetical protein
LYMSGPPPSAFDNSKKAVPPPVGRYSQRRVRIPPTFNLMVSVGAFFTRNFSFWYGCLPFILPNRLWVAKELEKPHF